jgi:hypothetical protein
MRHKFPGVDPVIHVDIELPGVMLAELTLAELVNSSHTNCFRLMISTSPTMIFRIQRRSGNNDHVSINSRTGSGSNPRGSTVCKVSVAHSAETFTRATSVSITTTVITSTSVRTSTDKQSQQCRSAQVRSEPRSECTTTTSRSKYSHATTQLERKALHPDFY